MRREVFLSASFLAVLGVSSVSAQSQEITELTAETVKGDWRGMRQSDGDLYPMFLTVSKMSVGTKAARLEIRGPDPCYEDFEFAGNVDGRFVFYPAGGRGCNFGRDDNRLEIVGSGADTTMRLIDREDGTKRWSITISQED